MIIADFLLCWRMDVPPIEDVEFTGMRWVAILADVAGAVVAIFTAGQFVPGVAAPQVLPGPAGAALNGLIAAFVVHTAAYYGLEEQGLLPGHDVETGTERL